MALQVWLPLNGTLENNGLSNVTVTNNGATVDNNGKIGKCYHFNSNTLVFPTSFTGKSICFWIKASKINSTIAFVDYNSQLAFGFYNGTILASSNLSTLQFNSSAFIENAWNHVTIIRQTSDVDLYINEEKLTDRVGSTNQWSNSTAGCYIGGRSTGNYMNCYINDFRIYDHALSPKEVQEISKGLVLHYKLDDPYIILSKCSNITYNLLINPNNFPNSISLKGITGIVNKSNGSITLNGDCTGYNVISIGHSSVSITSGHKYVFKGCPSGGASNASSTGGKYDYRVNVNNTYLSEIGNGLLWTSTLTGTINVYIRVGNGYSCNNLVFYPKLFDLTLMFGAGNEPTLEEFNLMFPYKSYSYDSGTTKSFSTTVYDSSGYGRNGTVIGTLTTNNDSPRYKLSTVFDGNTSGILIENLNISNIINTALTYSFWIKPNGENGARSVYFSSYSATTFAIEKTTSNKLRLYWNGSPDLTSTLSISDGEWQHIVITKNGTTEIKVYLNGILIQTLSNTYNNLTFPTTYRIGRDTRSGDGTPYKGNISDFRIYATALSEDDVLELYNTSAYIYNDGTIAAREFIETTNENPKVTKTGLCKTKNIIESPILCEYLQADGNSYINTLIPYDSTKNTYKIECKFSLPSNIGSYDAIFGTYKDESSKCLRIIRGNSNSVMWVYYNSKAGGGVLATFSTSNTNIREVIITATSVQRTESGITSTLNYSTYSGNDMTSVFYLFSQSPSTCLSNSRIYYFRFYDNNILLHDFVPCIYNGIPGMWDKIDYKFYSNNGTGTFVTGNVLENNNVAKVYTNRIESNQLIEI